MVISRQLLCALAAGILSAFPLRALGFPIKTQLETSASWIDNISRTSNPPEQREAARFSATATASTFRNWKSGFLTTADFSATLDTVPDYSGADAFTLGPQLGVRRRFGLGAYAPTLDLATGLAYRDARLRADDGWNHTATLRLSKRLTPSFRGAITGDWQRHDSHRRTFDTHHRRLFAELAWDVTPRWQLGTGAGRLSGNFTANASGSTWAKALSGALGSAVFDYYNTVAWQTTHLYGPDWVTYRVSGHADFRWIQLSPALGRNTSLPLRFERLEATNRIGIKYRQDLVTLTLLHRF